MSFVPLSGLAAGAKADENTCLSEAGAGAGALPSVPFDGMPAYVRPIWTVWQGCYACQSQQCPCDVPMPYSLTRGGKYSSACHKAGHCRM